MTRNDIHPSEMTSLSHYERADKPLISVKDVISYYKNTHEIKLTKEAFERINSLKIPTYGKSFVLCVGEKQIYWGAFWASYSSQSFDGVIILFPFLSEKENTIQITLGYPSPSFFRGNDPRSDPQIFQSLEKAGKLK